MFSGTPAAPLQWKRTAIPSLLNAHPATTHRHAVSPPSPCQHQPAPPPPPSASCRWPLIPSLLIPDQPPARWSLVCHCPRVHSPYPKHAKPVEHAPRTRRWTSDGTRKRLERIDAGSRYFHRDSPLATSRSTVPDSNRHGVCGGERFVVQSGTFSDAARFEEAKVIEARQA